MLLARDPPSRGICDNLSPHFLRLHEYILIYQVQYFQQVAENLIDKKA